MLELAIIFFIISVIYASIGFGGGSSYLAVLSLTTLPYESLRVIALVCNIIVVGGALFWYWKNNMLQFKKVLPLILLSIPLAFIGGTIQLEEKLFFIILSIVLFLSGIAVLANLRLIVPKNNLKKMESVRRNVAIGGVVGFVSGLVGIGGGIFLSPILHLTKWDNAKIIAGACSFFILVNSIAGLIGTLSMQTSVIRYDKILLLGTMVFIGGQIGTNVTIRRLNPDWIRVLTAILIIGVAIKIFIDHI